VLLQIAVPVAVFTVIVLCLTVLVLAARRRLEPSGVVSVVLNGGQSLEISAGGRLLRSLAENDIYLPAACGGRGTCGQCRVRVVSGGGYITPPEELHISRNDITAGFRLACMLKVREPLAIDVPDDILAARHFAGVVTSNRSIATYLKELVVELDEPIEFEAGDYVLVDAPPHRLAFEDIEIDTPFRAGWQESGLFDLKSVVRASVTRAYSLANPPQDRQRAVLVVKIALPPPGAPSGTPPGQVSSYLFGLKTGDRVDIRGPFGEFHVQNSDREILLIGGGAGVSPLRSIVLDLLSGGSKRKIAFWYGARDRNELCYAEEFSVSAEQHENFDYQIALSNEDPASGWHGHRGFIHAVVYKDYLKTHPAPESIEYYLCGPPLMSAAVLQMLERLGVPRDQVFFDDFGS